MKRMLQSFMNGLTEDTVPFGAEIILAIVALIASSLLFQTIDQALIMFSKFTLRTIPVDAKLVMLVIAFIFIKIGLTRTAKEFFFG